MKLDKFIKRPVLSTVISIVMVILGFIGLISLPIEQYPNIAPPTIMVRASYTGANAETVLNSVLAPLEEQINGVEGMTYMTSSATNSGSASITVFFKQGMDADMCQVNVQNRVSQASALLPAEVTKAGVQVMKRQSSTVILFGLTADDDRYDDEFLANYANINVVPAIKRVNGVGECQCFSQKDYTMRLWIDPVKMKSYGLIPTDLTGVLAQQNIEAAPGSVGENTDKQYEYTFRYKGRLKTPEEFGYKLVELNHAGSTHHDLLFLIVGFAKVKFNEAEYRIVYHIHIIGIYTFRHQGLALVVLNLFGTKELHQYQVGVVAPLRIASYAKFTS